MSRIRQHIALIVILIVAIIIRFIFLDRIPPAISGDELQYVMNAKAFLLSGYDLSGKISVVSPLIFSYPLGILPQAELPYYLLLPFVTLPLSLLTSRLPFYLLGIASIPVMYFLGRKLGGKRVGIFAALFTVFNPWLFLISHTAYESTVAMFFYMLGMLLLLILRGKKLLLSLPIFLFAFYAYIGTKIILVPFVLAILLYLYLSSQKYKKERQWLIIILGSTILLSLVFFLLQKSSGRIGEILTPFSSQITESVNYVRQISLSYPLLSFFENRLSIYMITIMQKVLDIFSTNYLFVSGDNFFGMWRHGIFYVFDALLLVAGFAFLFKKQRPLAYLLIALLFIGILPQVVHKQIGNFTPHITLIIPLLLLIAAFGAAWLWELLLQVRFSFVFKIITGCIYLLFVSYFLHQFYFQYPLQGAYDFSSRTLARYIHLAEANGEEVIVFSHRPSDLYKKYMLYTNGFNKTTLPKVRSAVNSNSYIFNNVTFENCGDKQKEARKGVMITDALCTSLMMGQQESALINPKNDSEEYFLTGDTLCKSSRGWMSQKPTLDDYEVEKLSAQQFCSVFLRQAR